MIRVADYIAKTIADRGVRHVFMLVGGGAMFLNHAFGQERRITCIFQHHEQACAMAAEGYARVSDGIGVINVTTGPGGINALNGVYGAWTDSIPMLIVSGQVKRETCLATYRIPGLRQLGDQETDIISMVRGITKYAVLIDDPSSIRYHLEKALHLATLQRPGPCWLDIPIDVQSAMIEEKVLTPYNPDEDKPSWRLEDLSRQCRIVLDRLRGSARPVIMVGTGVRLAGAVDIFDTVIHKLGIPVTTAWTHDLIASDDPLFCGRPGTIGTRPGNFTVQNADTLLVIGSRLNIRQVGYNWTAFAREAFKIQVDADRAEMAKPTVKSDLAIHCDARLFLEELNLQINADGHDAAAHKGWLAWCRERLERYPAVLPKHREFNGYVNPYHFVERLFDCLRDDDIVVTSNGSACVVPFQAAKIRKGQRLFSNSGNASMGYDLPAAIGAAIAGGGRRVICLAGDGSIQLNIQELVTIVSHRLPIKIFVLNNNGYLSIRDTQKNFFGSLMGESPQTGVFFPDIMKIGRAYGLPVMRIHCADFSDIIKVTIDTEGPALCEVILDPDQGFEPRVTSKQLPEGRIVSAPLEDMYPFLERDELLGNLFIKPLDY